MDIETVKAKVLGGDFMLSAHADQAAADESIAIAGIREARFWSSMPTLDVAPAA